MPVTRGKMCPSVHIPEDGGGRFLGCQPFATIHGVVGLTRPVTAMIALVFSLPYRPVNSLLWTITESVPHKTSRVYFVAHSS